MTTRRRCLVVVSLCATMATAVEAQGVQGSIGGQVAGLRLRAIGEGPAGIGIRATADAGRIGIDGGVTLFPENPSGNFGERLWLVGGRLRLLGRRHALFARGRAGTILFAGDYFRDRLSDRHHPAYDIGLTFERASRRLVLRVDAGDLLIPFGGATILQTLPPGPAPLGVTHNPMIAVGAGLRFGPTPW